MATLIELYSKVANKDFVTSEKELRETLFTAIQSRIDKEQNELKAQAKEGQVILSNNKEQLVVELDDAMIEVVRAYQSLAKQGFEKIVLDQIDFMKAFANSMNFKAISGSYVNGEGKKVQKCLSSSLVYELSEKVKDCEIKKAIIVFKNIDKHYDEDNQVKKSSKIVFTLIEWDKEGKLIYDKDLERIIPHFNRKSWSEDKRKVLFTLVPTK